MTDEDKKKIVLERLRGMPFNMKISIGEFGDFDKDEIISHVEKEDEIGKKI